MKNKNHTRVNILLPLTARIISLSWQIWADENSLTSPFFIEVPLPS
jgi:hypothetical protein